MTATIMYPGMITVVRAQGAGSTILDASQIEQRLQQGRTRVPHAPAPELPTAPAVPKPESESEISFVLAGVFFEGATVFPAADFSPLYTEFLAQTIGRAELDEIAARVTAAYTDAGYFLTRAIVPVQDIEGGILRVRIIEGYLAAIRFQGADKQGDLLDSYADSITAGRPARLSVVERGLLLINGLSGVQVNDMQVTQLDDEGAYELVVDVSYVRAEGATNLDNRGTPEVGRLQAYLSGAVNSVAGFGEQLQLAFATVPDQPKELIYGRIAYEQPIGRDGVILGVNVSASAIDVGATLSSQDTDSRSLSIGVNVRYPLVLSRRQSVYLRASFVYQDVKEDRAKLSTIDDRLRVVRLQADYSVLDSWDGSNFFSFEVSQGLGILNASDPNDPFLSRADGEGVFTKFKINIIRVQKIFGPVSLRLAAQGQGALAPLFSSEEILLGGGQFGRAYDFGEVSGDDGAAGSIELSYHRDSEATILNDYEVYGFYDAGAVWNRNSVSGQRRISLASAGGGIRLGLLHGIQASIEAAKPLTRSVSSEGDHDWRVFFSLGAQF